MLTRLRCTTSRGALRDTQLRAADDALERVALRFGGTTGDTALDELAGWRMPWIWSWTGSHRPCCARLLRRSPVLDDARRGPWSRRGWS